MYIVIELQKTGTDVGSIVNKYESLLEAESRFHQILAAAAISEVEIHSAVILGENGNLIKNGSYAHQVGEPNTVEINNNTVI